MKFFAVCFCLGFISLASALDSCYTCGHVNFLEGHQSTHPNVTALLSTVRERYGTDERCLRHGPAHTYDTVPCTTHCVISDTVITFKQKDTGKYIKYEYKRRGCVEADNDDPKDGCIYTGSQHYFNVGQRALAEAGYDPNTLSISGTHCYCNENNCNTHIPRMGSNAAATFTFGAYLTTGLLVLQTILSN